MSPPDSVTRGLRYSSVIRPPPINDKQVINVQLASIASTRWSVSTSVSRASVASQSTQLPPSPPPSITALASVQPRQPSTQALALYPNVQSSHLEAIPPTISQGLLHPMPTSSHALRDHQDGTKGSPTFENRICCFEPSATRCFESSATRISSNNPFASSVSLPSRQANTRAFQPNRVATKPKTNPTSAWDLIDSSDSSPMDNSNSLSDQDLPLLIGDDSLVTTCHTVSSSFTDTYTQSSTNSDGIPNNVYYQNSSELISTGFQSALPSSRSSSPFVANSSGATLARLRKKRDIAQDRFRRAMEKVKTNLSDHWSSQTSTLQVQDFQEQDEPFVVDISPIKPHPLEPQVDSPIKSECLVSTSNEDLSDQVSTSGWSFDSFCFSDVDPQCNPAHHPLTAFATTMSTTHDTTSLQVHLECTPSVTGNSPTKPETFSPNNQVTSPSVLEDSELFATSDQAWGVHAQGSAPSPSIEVASSKLSHVSTRLKSHERQHWPHVYPYKIKTSSSIISDPAT